MTQNSYAKTAIILLLALFLCLQSSLGASENKSDYYLLEDEYKSGGISYEEKLIQQTNYLFGAGDYAPNLTASIAPPIKSGTGLMLAVTENWDNFDADQKAQLTALIGRPTMQFAYDSPAGHFKIHYNTFGPEMVPDQDDNGNLIPDIVERAAVYFDSSWFVYIEYRGFLPPPSDNGTGGDDKYDIYLLAIGGYGITYPDEPGDSAWNDYSSFIGIHYNFYDFPANDDPEGDSIGAQKVTCAHELFHAVQLAYNYDVNNLWLMESSAVRMEEVLFPEVNDNFNYLPFFFNEPEVSLDYNDYFNKYGAFVWPTYLEHRFDPLIMRPVWEACRYNPALAALDSALLPHAVAVDDVFPEFALWNHFCGTQAVPGKYYPEAAAYPEIDVDLSYATLYKDSIGPLYAPDGLACNYILLNVDDTARGILELKLEGSFLARWALSAAFSSDAGDTVLSEAAYITQPIYLHLPYIEDYQSVTAIPTVISSNPDDNTYYLSSSVLRYGDANYDRVVNVGDAVYLISHVFKGSSGPQPIWQSGDANCDGNVNVGDAVTLINYIFRGGAVPCSDR